MITGTIGKKEHKPPSEIEQWCLPDIVLLYSLYFEEIQQITEATKDIPKE